MNKETVDRRRGAGEYHPDDTGRWLLFASRAARMVSVPFDDPGSADARGSFDRGSRRARSSGCAAVLPAARS